MTDTNQVQSVSPDVLRQVNFQPVAENIIKIRQYCAMYYTLSCPFASYEVIRRRGCAAPVILNPRTAWDDWFAYGTATVLLREEGNSLPVKWDAGRASVFWGKLLPLLLLAIKIGYLRLPNPWPIQYTEWSLSTAGCS